MPGRRTRGANARAPVCLRGPPQALYSLQMLRALPLWLLSALPLAAQAPPAGTLPEPSFAFLQSPPAGLPAMPLPPGAPPTAATFALGHRLFADPILSIDRTVSCRSCHPPATGFASPEPRPAGVQGRRALRHAPALLNRGYGRTMRWDGSTASLDAFVLEPIADPDEMGLPLAEALARLQADDGYRQEFAAAFPDGVTEANVAAALATFVRGIVAGDAPVDRFQRGDTGALTADQRAGLWLFESKAGCWRCHPPPLFTDEGFHNTGIGVEDGVPRPGRAAHTGDESDRGRFKTPTLRGVGLTAPYMHDGSVPTLPEVVEFYARGGNANDGLDAQIRPLSLSARERRQLVLFLESL